MPIDQVPQDEVEAMSLAHDLQYKVPTSVLQWHISIIHHILPSHKRNRKIRRVTLNFLNLFFNGGWF